VLNIPQAEPWSKYATGDPRAKCNRARVPLENDAAYLCPRCSEQNFVAVDPSGGRRQRFVEDCPVCCNPIQFAVMIDRDGDVVVESAELAT